MITIEEVVPTVSDVIKAKSTESLSDKDKASEQSSVDKDSVRALLDALKALSLYSLKNVDTLFTLEDDTSFGKSLFQTKAQEGLQNSFLLQSVDTLFTQSTLPHQSSNKSFDATLFTVDNLFEKAKSDFSKAKNTPLLTVSNLLDYKSATLPTVENLFSERATVPSQKETTHTPLLTAENLFEESSQEKADSNTKESDKRIPLFTVENLFEKACAKSFTSEETATKKEQGERTALFSVENLFDANDLLLTGNTLLRTVANLLDDESDEQKRNTILLTVANLFNENCTKEERNTLLRTVENLLTFCNSNDENRERFEKEYGVPLTVLQNVVDILKTFRYGSLLKKVMATCFTK